jgi:hypothetical protein
MRCGNGGRGGGGRLRAVAASSASVWRWRTPLCGNSGHGGLLRRQRRRRWRTPAAAVEDV